MLLVLLSGNPTERTDEHIVGVAGTILLPSEGVRVLAHRATHGRVALGANIPEFPIQLGNVPLLKRDREVVVLGFVGRTNRACFHIDDKASHVFNRVALVLLALGPSYEAPEGLILR